MAAYVIAEVSVTDPALYEDYKKLVPATVAKYGGRFAVRGRRRLAATVGGWGSQGQVLQGVFGSDFDPTQYRMLLFGLAMVLIMIWKPRGLISDRQPTIALGRRKSISGALVKEGHG